MASNVHFKNRLEPIKNSYSRLLQKLNALKGSPQKIAKGFATGVAMSFTPFVGFHILLSLVITKITKQNGTAAILGTIAGNPWTFPFIWYLTLHTGYLLQGDSPPFPTIDFKIFFSKLYHAVINLDIQLFISDIWPIFLPMLIGAIPYYIMIWFSLSHITFKVLLKNSEDRRYK